MYITTYCIFCIKFIRKTVNNVESYRTMMTAVWWFTYVSTGGGGDIEGFNPPPHPLQLTTNIKLFKNISN